MRSTARGSSRRRRSVERLDWVADHDHPGPDDVAVHAELELVVAGDTAVGLDHGQGGEVPQAGLGVERRDHAPGNRLARADLGFTDANPPAGPGVLLVWLAALDLHEHA